MWSKMKPWRSSKPRASIECAVRLSATKLLAGLALSVCLPAMAATLEEAEISGAWTGMLTGADGSQAEVQIDFSPQGFPLYSYTTNKGVERQVKLSHVGQILEYVPPGGGVQRMVVKSLEKGQGRLSVGIAGSFERASQGYMDQRQEVALFEYQLTANGLNMRVTTRSASHFGDKEMIVGGDPDSAVAEGLLQKLR
ncbi:MAG: exported protein of unknown function [Nitrospira sp.]|nr:exported protein of unknown function [Nitrospira sp.]